MRRNAFSKNLKTLRLENRITQQKLSEEMKISLKTLSHWETGYTEPSIDYILKLADYFNVSLDDLLSEYDS